MITVSISPLLPISIIASADHDALLIYSQVTSWKQTVKMIGYAENIVFFSVLLYSHTHIYAFVICIYICVCQCCYNAVNFLNNPHNRHPIARCVTHGGSRLCVYIHIYTYIWYWDGGVHSTNMAAPYKRLHIRTPIGDPAWFSVTKFENGQHGCELTLSERQIRLHCTSGHPLESISDISAKLKQLI